MTISFSAVSSILLPASIGTELVIENSSFYTKPYTETFGNHEPFPKGNKEEIPYCFRRWRKTRSFTTIGCYFIEVAGGFP